MCALTSRLPRSSVFAVPGTLPEKRVFREHVTVSFLKTQMSAGIRWEVHTQPHAALRSFRWTTEGVLLSVHDQSLNKQHRWRYRTGLPGAPQLPVRTFVTPFRDYHIWVSTCLFRIDSECACVWDSRKDGRSYLYFVLIWDKFCIIEELSFPKGATFSFVSSLKVTVCKPRAGNEIPFRDFALYLHSILVLTLIHSFVWCVESILASPLKRAKHEIVLHN
jgi:hypothetical protein